jgi:hypothetical protein
VTVNWKKKRNRDSNPKGTVVRAPALQDAIPHQTWSLQMTKILDQMFNMAFILAIIVLSIMHADAQDTTYYGADGRRTGTASTSGNMTTYRDSFGRNVGTGTTDSAGTTTFRDGSGRTTGTRTAPRGVR